MTYDAFETSVESGQPVELYDFNFGSDTFRFTSAEDNVVVGSDTYTAIEIASSAVKISQEQRAQALEVTMPSNNTFATKFIGIQPGQEAVLTIRKFHRTDTPTPQVLVVFKGTVKAVSFDKQGHRARFSILPLSALNNFMPRRTYQGLCNHVLYDSRCQVVEGSFRYVNTVSAVSANGRTLTVPGLDAAKGVGFATAGFVTIPSISEFRLILSHSATDQIEILLPFVNSPLGVSVEVLAGCDHTIATCKTKFNNVINFGGFAFVPLKNVFTAGVTPGASGAFGSTSSGGGGFASGVRERLG